jgi:hypothetical protein
MTIEWQMHIVISLVAWNRFVYSNGMEKKFKNTLNLYMDEWKIWKKNERWVINYNTCVLLFN